MSKSGPDNRVLAISGTKKTALRVQHDEFERNQTGPILLEKKVPLVFAVTSLDFPCAQPELVVDKDDAVFKAANKLPDELG
jgi:hypothetical protein